MRARTWWAAVAALFVPAALVAACSGDDSTGGATDDGGRGDATVASDGAGDAKVDTGTGADANTHDAAAGDAALDAGPGHDLDATPPVPELLSPAACPIGLAVGPSRFYWTDTSAYGCTPAVSGCPITGCPDAAPPPIYTGTSGQSLPTGVGVVASDAGDNVYYTYNQGASEGLWRLQGDGGARTLFTDMPSNGGGLTVGSDGVVFWAGNPGIFRNAAGAATSAKVLPGLTGIPTQGIGVDDTAVFAGTTTALYSCPRGGDCTSSGSDTATKIADVTDLQEVASDGTNVYFTALTSAEVTLYRCPVAGCPSATPIVLAQTSTTHPPEQFGSGLAVDDFAVYWGATDGSIYVCAKAAAAPCTPKAWVRDAALHPVALVTDATYLYWTDLRSDVRGVYRVKKP